jgi:hypothetical protein
VGMRVDEPWQHAGAGPFKHQPAVRRGATDA